MRPRPFHCGTSQRLLSRSDLLQELLRHPTITTLTVNGRSAGVEEVLQAATETTIGKVHPLRTMGTGIVSIKLSSACLEGSSQSAVPASSESGQRCVNGPSKRLPWLSSWARHVPCLAPSLRLRLLVTSRLLVVVLEIGLACLVVAYSYQWRARARRSLSGWRSFKASHVEPCQRLARNRATRNLTPHHGPPSAAPLTRGRWRDRAVGATRRYEPVGRGRPVLASLLQQVFSSSAGDGSRLRGYRDALTSSSAASLARLETPSLA